MTIPALKPAGPDQLRRLRLLGRVVVAYYGVSAAILLAFIVFMFGRYGQFSWLDPAALTHAGNAIAFAAGILNLAVIVSCSLIFIQGHPRRVSLAWLVLTIWLLLHSAAYGLLTGILPVLEIALLVWVYLAGRTHNR